MMESKEEAAGKGNQKNTNRFRDRNCLHLSRIAP